MFPRISVCFTYAGLTYCRCARGIVRTLQYFQPPRRYYEGTLWTFDVDDVSQNNSTIVSNAMRVFYDCCELRNLRNLRELRDLRDLRELRDLR